MYGSGLKVSLASSTSSTFSAELFSPLMLHDGCDQGLDSRVAKNLQILVCSWISMPRSRAQLLFLSLWRDEIRGPDARAAQDRIGLGTAFVSPRSTVPLKLPPFVTIVHRCAVPAACVLISGTLSMMVNVFSPRRWQNCRTYCVAVPRRSAPTLWCTHFHRPLIHVHINTIPFASSPPVFVPMLMLFLMVVSILASMLVSTSLSWPHPCLRLSQVYLHMLHRYPTHLSFVRGSCPHSHHADAILAPVMRYLHTHGAIPALTLVLIRELAVRYDHPFNLLSFHSHLIVHTHTHIGSCTSIGA